MNPVVADKIEKFFSHYRVRQYPKGQILILNGDAPDHIYNLVKGKVKQYDITYRGDEVILNVFKEGTFFPMSHAIHGGESRYCYEAETAIEVRQVPSRDALAFIMSNPDVMLDLLSRVYRGLDGMMGRMAHLMSGTAKGRLMNELVIEAVRFGTAQEGGYLLNVTEKDLGARAGMSRETVSREAKKLKAAGLIEVRSRSIFVKDLALLQNELEKEA